MIRSNKYLKHGIQTFVDVHLSAPLTEGGLVPGELPGRGLQVEVLEAGGVVRGRLQVVLQSVQCSAVQCSTVH